MTPPPVTGRSLGFRMAIVFSGLIAVIGLFMFAFFPSRMAQQAQQEARARALSIAQITATALGPALEFEDPDNAASILGWLGSTRDARFGAVRDADGKLITVWRPTAVPARQIWSVRPGIETMGQLMIVTVPILAIGGGRGTLHLGFSLEHLDAQRNETRRTVALATILVFSVGVLASMVIAALLVGPIRKLTRTARKISRGELPAVLPEISGGDEVAQLVAALREMLERIHAESQQELLQASRHAGMAEVATGVLHNVGNVLTSVNVSVELLRERTAAQPIDRLQRLHDLLSAASAGQSVDVTRLAAALKYISVVSESLETGRAGQLKDLETLRGHVEHMKRVVAMQNAYARVRSVVEPTRAPTLLDEAIEMGCPPHRRGAIAITRTVAPDLEDEPILIDRHRVLQIVVNLISNARDAVNGSSGARTIGIAASRVTSGLQISVTDSGVGIAAELLERIFSAGFTSKPTGHGYGLHSSALAARQAGGSLAVTSEGEGRGATFTLTVPIEVAS
ncbi:MAG: ATP-binding protein [Kofleriaceae bacterium]